MPLYRIRYHYLRVNPKCNAIAAIMTKIFSVWPVWWGPGPGAGWCGCHDTSRGDRVTRDTWHGHHGGVLRSRGVAANLQPTVRGKIENTLYKGNPFYLTVAFANSMIVCFLAAHSRGPMVSSLLSLLWICYLEYRVKIMGALKECLQKIALNRKQCKIIAHCKMDIYSE